MGDGQEADGRGWMVGTAERREVGTGRRREARGEDRPERRNRREAHERAGTGSGQ